ncbi:MAG: hydrogenase maturation nickel metallochaperone HypA [Clostridium sp.]
MHELSMISSVIQMTNEIARSNSIDKVTKVIIQIGEMTCVENHGLIFAFDAIKKDTVCSKATLEIQNIKAKAYCRGCNKEFYIGFTTRVCPKCNEYSSDIVAGEELLLYRIEGHLKGEFKEE